MYPEGHQFIPLIIIIIIIINEVSWLSPDNYNVTVVLNTCDHV
jgi:hypothetical protein